MSKTNFPEIALDTNIKILLNKKKDTGYRIAGHFAIAPVHAIGDIPEFQTTSNELFIEAGTHLNGPLRTLIQNGILASLGHIKLSNGKTFTKYRFYRELMDKRYITDDEFDNDSSAMNENDCLKFAESITSFVQFENASAFNKQLQQEDGPPILHFRDGEEAIEKGKPTKRSVIFGDTHKNNKAIMNLIQKNTPEKTNHYANPKQGELYAIVRSSNVKNKSPYHIAFVIYSDEEINITMEAEADNGPLYYPKFCLYDKGYEGNTFHRRWTGEIYKKSDPDRYKSLYTNGTTVVLSIDGDIANIRDIFDKNIIPTGYIEPITEPIQTMIVSSSSKGSRRSKVSTKRSRSK